MANGPPREMRPPAGAPMPAARRRALHRGTGRRRLTSLGRGALGAALLVLAAAQPGAADAPAPRFGLPVGCVVGETCMIQNHFDHDPGPAARDYACGGLTYDGHDGTDIRVADLPAMARGVAVVAAAAGRVRAVRDGMADIDVRAAGGPAAVRGREAGNGVVVDHGGGWESQYSHLRRGSVAVAPGDRVAAGRMLGLVGMSGLAEFPHLHFEIRRAGRPVDPFVGPLGPADRWTACGPGPDSLWSRAALAALAYRPGGLLSAGFAGVVPDWTAARRGDYAAPALPRDSAVLVFWTAAFGVREGDREEARLTGPDGTVITETDRVLDQPKALWFGYFGRKRRGALWPAGTYRGDYRLTRAVDGEWREVARATRTVELR